MKNNNVTSKRLFETNVRAKEKKNNTKLLMFLYNVLHLVAIIGAFVGFTILFTYLGINEHPSTEITTRLMTATIQSFLATFIFNYAVCGIIDFISSKMSLIDYILYCTNISFEEDEEYEEEEYEVRDNRKNFKIYDIY